MFSNRFVTNFPSIVPVKNYENRLIVIWRIYGQKFAAYFFGATLQFCLLCSCKLFFTSSLLLL